jgi:conjugative transfer pilus assembly protein TraH
VFVKYYKCSDFAACATLTELPTYTFEPFTTKVEKLMRSLSDKIATRSGAPTPQEIGFVNSVNEPVYRMLSIGNAVKGSGQAEILIAKYRDVIAVDYTYTFLDRELRKGLDAILTQWKLSLPQQEQAKALRERIAALLVRIGQERTAAYGKVQSFAAVATHLEQLERQLRSSMPQHVIDLIGYSTPLPGR